MARRGFRLVYPSNGRVSFDGGLNNKFERSIIAENESPDCLNVRFQDGGVETRQGSTQVASVSVGTSPGGLYTRHDRTGAETMVAWANGSLKTWDGSTFATVPSAQSIYTIGKRVTAAEQENYMFFGNGDGIPYKWNGAEFTRHGIYAPASAPSIVSNATGALTGDYRYLVTTLNSNLAESDTGPSSTTLTLASATVRVTLPTFAASYGVSARRVYRTEDGGATFKRLATISDNTTTFYDDDADDSALGTNAPTENGIPPNYSFVHFHQNRLFVISPESTAVKYSNLGDPYNFAATNFINLGDNSGDIPKACYSWDTHLLVICDRSAYLIYMPDTDDTNWQQVKVQIPYGTKSPFGVFPYQDKVMFPALQNDQFVGFGAIRGAAIDPSAAFLTLSAIQSDLKSQRIEPDMFLVPEAYAEAISAVVFENRAYIALPYGLSQTANNRTLVFDFSIDRVSKKQKDAWSWDDGNNPYQFTVYDGGLYFIDATDGMVYEYEDGSYNDAGSAINSYFWTKEFTLNSSNHLTFFDFRYAKALIDLAGDFPMHFGYRVDSDKGVGNRKDISLDPGSNLWGTMVWGVDQWGGGSEQEDVKIFLGSTRGERIQFYFSNKNTADQRFKVHGLRFYYNEKGFR